MNELPKVCSYHGRDNEPCYGIVDEYYDEKERKWIDYCEGHQGVPYGGFYIPKDPIRRWIFSQQNQRIREQKSEIDMLWEMVKLADKKLQVLDIGEIELPQSRLETLQSYYD